MDKNEKLSRKESKKKFLELMKKLENDDLIYLLIYVKDELRNRGLVQQLNK